MKMTSIIAILVVALACTAQVQAAEPRLYPLTQQQAVDESTLAPVILADRIVASQTHPDQQVRWVKVRYFSDEWKDGPWHGEMTVALPPKIKQDCQGLAALTLAGVGKRGMEPGFDAPRDLAECTALEFGIPVATMPQQGTHFGLTEIHALSDHLTKRFVETLSYEAGRISAHVRVSDKTAVQGVNLVWAPTINPEFLGSAHIGPRNAKKDNYSQARWQTVPMTRNNKTWTVTFALPSPKPKFVACFVHVHDEYKRRPGHITSLIRQLPIEQE